MTTKPARLLYKGFTLIEMMMVVAIIGILATMAAQDYQIYIAKTQVAVSYQSFQRMKREIASYHIDTGAQVASASLDSVIPGLYYISGNCNNWTFRVDPKDPYYFTYWRFGQCPTYTNGDPIYPGFSLKVTFDSGKGNSRYIADRSYQLVTFDMGQHSICTASPGGMDWYGINGTPVPEYIMPVSCRQQPSDYAKIRHDAGW